MRWGVGGGGGSEQQRRFRKIVFSADVQREQIWHEQRCPLFDVVRPVFPLTTTVSPTFQGTTKLGCGKFPEARHHHYLSLNREGRWGTTDDITTGFLHFFLFSTALWDLTNSRPVHSPMLSFHRFLCVFCLLSPITVPCKMVLARPDERKT